MKYFALAIVALEILEGATMTIKGVDDSTTLAQIETSEQAVTDQDLAEMNAYEMDYIESWFYSITDEAGSAITYDETKETYHMYTNDYSRQADLDF